MAESATAEEAPTPEPAEPSTNPEAACAGYFFGPDGFTLEERVRDAVLDIGPAMDGDDAQIMIGIGERIEELIAMSPPDMARALRKIQTPFTQVADYVRAGGGKDLTLDTGEVRDGVPLLMEACVDHGFTVDGD